MKTNSVENRIRSVAENPIDGKLNLVQYKKQKAQAMTHKEVCEQIVDYANGNPYMPIYAILACGVSADAFKNAVFDSMCNANIICRFRFYKITEKILIGGSRYVTDFKAAVITIIFYICIFFYELK